MIIINTFITGNNDNDNDDDDVFNDDDDYNYYDDYNYDNHDGFGYFEVDVQKLL